MANKERIKEVLSNLIDVKFPKLNEPSEYYIMPRVRFHPSIERDHLLEIARETMKEKRPECQECCHQIKMTRKSHNYIRMNINSTKKVKLEELLDDNIFGSFEKELLYWNIYRVDKSNQVQLARNFFSFYP